MQYVLQMILNVMLTCGDVAQVGLAERSGSGEQTGQSNWRDSGAAASEAAPPVTAELAEQHGVHSQIGHAWELTEQDMEEFGKGVPLQPG